ncbi:MAG: HNH endonuclease [Deferribacteraceae bacterium]|jgi:5-methylcytosine-specific restriction endonuclease McrA|nr:HNH endonuclease [Deferribacteraceae bacterium]
MFHIHITENEIKVEKRKARELRRTRWWKEKLYSGLCEYCGKKIPPEELTMDHIVPLIRGGKSVKNNIAVCCKACNNSKKYLLPSEWER